MDIIDVDSELKNETSRFFQEKLHDDVVNIIQQWKLNAADFDIQFKGRTYTKVKRKMNLFGNEESNNNSRKKFSNTNMEIGGLVTNNEKNNLLNVSPPNSIFSATNMLENSMANSLITSMDFIDVNAFENNEQTDEDYFTENLKNLKEKFGNNSKSTIEYNNLNDLNTSFEENEKYLTINLKKDRPAFSIPSCSSEDFTSDEIIDSSPSPILDDDGDDNNKSILHNNINLGNTINLSNNYCPNKTLTLKKNGDPILNCTFDGSLDNIENVTFVQSTPLRNHFSNNTLANINDELELSPVPRTVLSIPKTIEKIKNRYSINNNGSLEKPVQQITENVKDLNAYSPQNGRLLAKRNRIYEVQDIDVNEIEKDQNITRNLNKEFLKCENETKVENLSKNLDDNNKLNLTCTIEKPNKNVIKDEKDQMENTGKQAKIGLLKHRIPRDLSADRKLIYTKNQHFSVGESRLKKPTNKDITNVVQANQYHRQIDSSGASNNIQRASSASDIAFEKRTEKVAQQNLETKSKSFKNLSSNLNQVYRKSNLVAPSKISYRADANNFAIPNPVRKTVQGSGIPHRPLQTNDAPKITPISTPTSNGTGRPQIPQPSRIKRSGLPRPSKLH